MGIFAGSGVGKSVLLGMMARYTAADVNVIALVGERGREVNEFLERDLGPQGLARSVVVVATSDEPALLRMQAAQTATAIAEVLPRHGARRAADYGFGHAVCHGPARDRPGRRRASHDPRLSAVGLCHASQACRARRPRARGSITGFYSVLVEGDDPQEPISDTVRGLLDGHTWLSRKLAARAHYPAIDILGSISRLMTEITPRKQQEAAQTVRELLAAHTRPRRSDFDRRLSPRRQSHGRRGDRHAGRDPALFVSTDRRAGDARRRRRRARQTPAAGSGPNAADPSGRRGAAPGGLAGIGVVVTDSDSGSVGHVKPRNSTMKP